MPHGVWQGVGVVVYVRFQATVPNRHGRYPGVFGLVNGLAAEGRLTEEQAEFRRACNNWYHATVTDPSTVDPSVYDRERNPGAAAWFKTTATEPVARVAGYLDILAAHGIGCEELRSADPGRVIYEDEHQVVVVPR